MKLNYQGNYVKSSPNTKFLGFIIDDFLLWRAHIDQTMSKLNTACFFNLNDTSYNVYRNFKNGLFCTYTFSYELRNNFWGNQPYSQNIFKFQKRVIRIITNSRTRDSCRELFKKLVILPLYSLYFFSINICDQKQTFILYK